MNRKLFLEDIRRVVELSEFVHIHQEPLTDLCDDLTHEELVIPNWDTAVDPSWDEKTRLGYFILFNLINFSYWGEKHWFVEIKGQRFQGSTALMTVLRQAITDGYPLLDGHYLSQLSQHDAEALFCRSMPIPLLEERLAILRQAGQCLLENFQGQFWHVVAASNQQALVLVDILIKAFPSFHDSTLYRGHSVAFFKRAQLTSAQIYGHFRGEGWEVLQNVDQLTVFADYRVPQILRHLNILDYTAPLAEKIDSNQPLRAGSLEEIEIRANTVWVGELMRNQLRARLPYINALHLDYWLWQQGVQASGEMAPHHRTRTIYY